jgi:hypothetical protein
MDELVAIRDEPGSPFHIARTTSITDVAISVHHHDCASHDTSRAVFRQAWHLPGSNGVRLAANQPPNHVPRAGTLTLDSLRESLVARNLECTAASRLRKKYQQVTAPKHDELFVFDEQPTAQKDDSDVVKTSVRSSASRQAQTSRKPLIFFAW